MSDMKCPFCNRSLHKGEDGIYSHLDYMTECKGRLFDGSAKLWQELTRTRKALDVAVDALKYANKCIKGGCVNWETEIDKALEKITALEQKQPTFVHNKIEFPEFNDNLLEEFDKQFFENGQDDI